MMRAFGLAMTAVGLLSSTSLASIGAQAAGAPQLEASLPWSSAGNGVTDNHYDVVERNLGTATVPLLVPRWVFAARRGGAIDADRPG